MKSMTGFGHSEFQNEKYQVSLEIKSYNNRYLDISINIPVSLGILEQRIREFLKERAIRGRIELYLRVRELSGGVHTLVDTELVKSYIVALEQIKKAAKIRGTIRLEHLAGMDGVLKTERSSDPEVLWPIILSTLETAYQGFELSRQREGDATVEDIRKQSARLRLGLDNIRAQVPKIEQAVSTGLRERFLQVVGDQVEEPRLLTETASLLVKHSINEEISRMESHLQSLEETLQKDTAGGKRLDFLCQELNREINTIGSKSFLIEISQEVVQLKDALENIREQLRNLE